MHLETEIEWGQRFIWRPRISECGDALEGHAWGSLDKYLEVIDLEVVDWSGGMTEAGILFKR